MQFKIKPISSEIVNMQLKQSHRHIQNTNKYLRWSFLGKKSTTERVNCVCKNLHLRYLTGLWIHFCFALLSFWSKCKTYLFEQIRSRNINILEKNDCSTRKSFFTLIHHLLISWILIASLKILLTTDFLGSLCNLPRPVFTCSKSTMETGEQCVKYVQS